MGRIQVFIIRAVMGTLLGVIVSRFFYPHAPLLFIVGLCAALVVLAYVTEYLRLDSKRKARMNPGPGRQ